MTGHILNDIILILERTYVKWYTINSWQDIFQLHCGHKYHGGNTKLNFFYIYAENEINITEKYIDN